jgi:MerR family copper efflux transcriptional regulator
MQISDVAEKTGLSPKTIRFYEGEGLIAPPARTAGGYRDYADREVAELAFLSRARDVGFSLEDCRQLLSLKRDSHRHSADAKAVVLARRKEVRDRIRRLREMDRELARLAALCRGDEEPECAILDDLAGEGGRS